MTIDCEAEGIATEMFDYQFADLSWVIKLQIKNMKEICKFGKK